MLIMWNENFFCAAESKATAVVRAIIHQSFIHRLAFALETKHTVNRISFRHRFAYLRHRIVVILVDLRLLLFVSFLLLSGVRALVCVCVSYVLTSLDCARTAAKVYWLVSDALAVWM